MSIPSAQESREDICIHHELSTEYAVNCVQLHLYKRVIYFKSSLVD